ncbi:protein Dr1-like protein [Cucumis melo var. makuwa]|uniref:Protein Dr1-like protein n=1 Tax=Cucumis melo var. makuwa TaxID=1194695 RepID=A0A5D3DXA3_CUCMM|nr:protein Dr1-like protein [Cucumis melo var. makuwa]
MEPMDIVGKSKEDASLPKATMTKIIKEMLPPDVRVARDAQDLLIECCVEFINLVSSESNEVCSKEEKRTIAPEHVLKALEVLGFSEYIEEVYAAYEQHRIETMQDSLKGGKWSNGAEMTEEEALAEQQRMFAEARARMNGSNTAPKQPEPEQNCLFANSYGLYLGWLLMRFTVCDSSQPNANLTIGGSLYVSFVRILLQHINEP